MSTVATQDRNSAASSPADKANPDGGASFDPLLKEFESPGRMTMLTQLQERWEASLGKLRATYPEIDDDPFFLTDLPSLLRRYLVAAKFDVDEAMLRLKATAEWRRDWDVMSYYRPGAAREVFSEDSNPGAEMYFADSLAYDRLGRPYVCGRLNFANAENMHPWRHLRAGIYVFEMMALKLAQTGRGPGSYVLDIGPVGNIAGTVSGTAGLARKYDESINPYYNAGAGTADAPSAKMLEEFGSLDNGFAVLKAAIQVLNRHYPGVVTRVYYLNSSMLFWGAFNVFSRWIADRGSITFSFLGTAAWRESPISQLLEVYAPDQLAAEWGGTGPSLDGDGFLQRAIDFYDSEALKRPAARRRLQEGAAAASTEQRGQEGKVLSGSAP